MSENREKGRLVLGVVGELPDGPDLGTPVPAGTDAQGELREDGYRGDFPLTVHGALRDLADWLDEADRLINLLADLHGKERPSAGDDVQQDMRCLADWFAAHPAVGANAWTYVRRARGEA